MPGSPPTSVSDPGTIQPPNTRLSSAPLSLYRECATGLISRSLEGLTTFTEEELYALDGAETEGALFCSMVFQALHAWHWPCHFVYSFPHLEQR